MLEYFPHNVSPLKNIFANCTQGKFNPFPGDNAGGPRQEVPAQADGEEGGKTVLLERPSSVLI